MTPFFLLQLFLLLFQRNFQNFRARASRAFRKFNQFSAENGKFLGAFKYDKLGTERPYRSSQQKGPIFLIPHPIGGGGVLTL